MPVTPAETDYSVKWHSLIQVLQHFALIDEASLQAAVSQVETKQQSLLDYLIEQQLVNAEQVAKACSAYFNLDYVDLHAYTAESLPVDLVNQVELSQQALLPLEKKAGQLVVAISDPQHFSLLEELQFQTGLSVQAVMVADNLLKQLINQLLNQQHYSAASFTEHNDQLASTDVISLVDRLISDAIIQGASDIHCEPSQNKLRLRIRVDGVLREVTEASHHLASSLASRLKVMAELDITERRLPQDGRFTFTASNGLSRDCRLNSCPVLGGEKLVIRLLEPNKKLLSFDELGLNEQQKTLLRQAIEKPQGLVLVTGPTGSGKTLSLYTALAHLNQVEHNIMTIEDPVEIQLQGINQVNVNKKAGLNFALALRAFLRQDPDIIMVGEIRDQETASIAIRAAQTGHLVLSTLHTNSAVQTLTRLLNMGIAPYNLSSSLHLIVAQRLVRRLCDHCKIAYSPSMDLLRQIGFLSHVKEKTVFYKPQGCRHCLAGYKGRAGIFEVLPINEGLTEAIMRQANSTQLAALVKKQGLQTLWQAALAKVQRGVTSFDEIHRVTIDDRL